LGNIGDAPITAAAIKATRHQAEVPVINSRWEMWLALLVKAIFTLSESANHGRGSLATG
jgi:hypothetical protein